MGSDSARRDRYLRLLVDVTAEFATKQDLPALFDAIAGRCAEELGDWCAIGRIDPEHPQVVIEALAHRDRAKAGEFRAALEAAPVPKGAPILAQILAADGPVVVSPDTSGMAGTWSRMGVVTAIVIPFAAAGGSKGILAVGAGSPRRWDDEEIRIASVIAERVGVAMRNAGLIESERQSRAAAERQARLSDALLRLQRRTHAEEKALSAIAMAIAGETDLGRVLALALDPLRQMIRFSGGSIVLVEGDEYIVRAAVGPHVGEVLGQRVSRDRGPIAQVVATGQPFHTEDRAIGGIPWIGPVHSCLAVPLSWHGRTFGVLEVHAVEAHALERGVLPLLQRVAAMLSGSVELARRYAAEVQATAEAETARRQLMLLAEASRLLATSLDVEATLSSIARLAVPALADWCAVDLVEGQGFVRRHVFHADPVKGRLAGELEDRYSPDPRAPQGAHKVIRTGQAEIWPETPDVLLAGGTRNARHLEVLRALGLGSTMVVPFVARGRMLGALTLVSTQAGRRYNSADLALAEEIARRAALALANAVLHQAEQEAREFAEHAADRTARLQAMTAALSGALTRSQVGDVIVEQGVHALGASAGLISLLSEDGTTLVVVRDVGFPEDVLRRQRRIPISTSSPMTDAVKTGQPVLFDSKDAMVERYPHLVDAFVLPQEGARAAIPLALGDRVLGVLVLVFPHPRDFPEQDRAFLRSLAQQCAQAIDRARLYEHEHRVAETLQRAFLPAGLPDLPGVTLNAAYVPGVSESEIGGDWYDVFRLPDGRVALSVGDVVGRGLQAAVIMGQLRQSIRAAALEFHSPVMVLDRAGRVLHLTYEAEGMATAVFGIFDPILLTFTYSTAGHPPPLLVQPDGRVEALVCGGLPLGVETPNIPPAWTVPVPRGSLLVLYTDGLIESTRNVVEGERALIDAVREEAGNPAPDPASAILTRMIPGSDPPDDVAILTMGVSMAARTRFDLAIRATPAAGRVVRQALRRFLAENDVAPELASNLEVALGEALNNAIEHAYGAIPGMVDVGGWREDAQLVVEVRDHGRWRPERQEDRGHGLQIMRGLVDTVDLQATESGTTVRLTLLLTRPLHAADSSPDS